MKYRFLLFALLLAYCQAWADISSFQPKYSVAGFFTLPETGRNVYSMNPAWRFYKGSVNGAESFEFDDSKWSVVGLPHGIEYLPTEVSGCINYQGEIWYRKHFVPCDEWKGKKLFLHFEAIMGKSKVWVNGELLKTHLGGFLPIVIDVTSTLKYGEDNVIAVWADNSDDSSYPPGKSQDLLDFTYCGGIYRDCWMIAHESVYITDPNMENEVASGGLFVSYNNVSERAADICLSTHVRNDSKHSFSGDIEYRLLDKENQQVLTLKRPLQVKKRKS